MIYHINFTDFENAFYKMDRRNQFPNGLKALFEYLEEYENDTGEEIELDVIALCCEFSEYDSAREAAQQYDWTDGDPVAWLQDRTVVIEFPEGVIIQNF